MRVGVLARRDRYSKPKGEERLHHQHCQKEAIAAPILTAGNQRNNGLTSASFVQDLKPQLYDDRGAPGGNRMPRLWALRSLRLWCVGGGKGSGFPWYSPSE